MAVTFDIPGVDQAVEVIDQNADSSSGLKTISGEPISQTAPIYYGRFSTQWVNFFTRLRNGMVGRSQADITSNRPTEQLVIGLPYYDTTLGKPIWIHQVNPTVVWHDATGAVV